MLAGPGASPARVWIASSACSSGLRNALDPKLVMNTEGQLASAARSQGESSDMRGVAARPARSSA